jgi:hypothetical protein
MTTQHRRSCASTLWDSRKVRPETSACVTALGRRAGCLVLCAQIFIGSVALAQNQPVKPSAPPPPDDPGDLGPGYPRLDQPWTRQPAQKKAAPKKAPKAAKPAPAAAQPLTVPPTTPAPAADATVTPSPSTTTAPESAAAPDAAPPPPMPRPRRNEISVSGDYFLGQGNVTLPFGFSLHESGVGGIQNDAAQPDRTSSYFGGTVSYSYGQAWYLDLGYANGSSSGDVNAKLGGRNDLPSHFSIDDTWYQGYLRYTFPSLRGKKLSAYLRAGFSYVDATLNDATVIPVLGRYHQNDKTQDYIGSVGFGAGYSLYSTRRIRLGLQAEGEGFYGQRTQKSLEVLEDAGVGTIFKTATINNDLYGGIGRATLRFEYRFGSGAFRAFADGGFQAKFTIVNYPGIGSFNELLWGPYVKAGIRYSF